MKYIVAILFALNSTSCGCYIKITNFFRYNINKQVKILSLIPKPWTLQNIYNSKDITIYKPSNDYNESLISMLSSYNLEVSHCYD